MIRIEFLGETHTVTWPDWATREELGLAYGAYGAGEFGQRVRVAAAAIALCSRVGRRLNVDYLKCGCNPLVVGGLAWQRLREAGHSNEEIIKAGYEILTALVEHIWPRASEVEQAKDFTPAEEPTT